MASMAANGSPMSPTTVKKADPGAKPYAAQDSAPTAPTTRQPRPNRRDAVLVDICSRYDGATRAEARKPGDTRHQVGIDMQR